MFLQLQMLLTGDINCIHNIIKRVSSFTWVYFYMETGL